ncbi:MAG: hypothetical protein Q9180_008303 [Flavoplaca navasiana]
MSRNLAVRLTRLVVLMILITSALLLSNYFSSHQYLRDSVVDLQRQSIASSFERRDHIFDSSPVVPDLLLNERALSSIWQDLVCTGEDYIDHAIQPAFKNGGHSQFPAPQFLFPLDAPKEVDAVYVLMEQAFTFTNAQGEPNLPATGAEFQAFMYARFKSGIIISLSTYGPSYEVEKSGVPENQVASRIPRLSQLSDALWESWIQVEKANPGHLRYYGVDTVQNEQSTPLIEEIFQASRGTLIVPWAKRLNFDLRSDEGKALRASQSGRAVAWMMIHHAAELKTRSPKVTLWSSFGARMSMIWDLVPEGEQGSFGDLEPL